MMPLIALLAALALAGGPPAADGRATVPGAINPAISQANMAKTICNPHWSTKAIRPPSSFTNKLKFAAMALAGIPRSRSLQYELDHDISLEIGGAPADPLNLWLQPYFGPLNAHLKDQLENRLHKLVCAGSISLAEAQHEISADWPASYRSRIGPIPAPQ